MPRLPQSVRDRLEASGQRQAHLKDRAPGCECLWCLGLPETVRRARERWAAEQARNGEPPF